MYIAVAQTELEIIGDQLAERVDNTKPALFAGEKVRDFQRDGINNLVSALGSLTTFEIDPERPLLVFGENGSGKSVLTRAIGLALDKAVCEAHWQSSGEFEEYRGTFYSRRTVRLAERISSAGLGLDFSKVLHVKGTDRVPLQKSGLSVTIDPSTETIDKPTHLSKWYGREHVEPSETGYDGGVNSRRQQLDAMVAKAYRNGLRRDEGVGDVEHGEKSASDATTYMIGDNLPPIALLMDEPESGLSPRRYEALAEEVLTMNGSFAHIVIATNSLVLWNLYQDQDERFTYLDLNAHEAAAPTV